MWAVDWKAFHSQEASTLLHPGRKTERLSVEENADASGEGRKCHDLFGEVSIAERLCQTENATGSRTGASREMASEGK